MSDNFILLHSYVTFADIAIAVKMKWGYVLQGDIIVDVITVNDEVKLKVSIKES